VHKNVYFVFNYPQNRSLKCSVGLHKHTANSTRGYSWA